MMFMLMCLAQGDSNILYDQRSLEPNDTKKMKHLKYNNKIWFFFFVSKKFKGQ